MKYRLTIDVTSPEKLTTWDIVGNLPNLLKFALDDVQGTELQRFSLTRTDGPPIDVLVERCVEVPMAEWLPS